MARRRIPRIYELTFDGDLEGLHVKVKSIKFGKVRQLMGLLDADDKDMEALDEVSKLLAESIVSWDLLDEEGQPVEPTLEEINELEFSDVMAIVNKWLDEITGPDKELGKGSNSGESFPGRPLTMEAL